MLEYLQQFGYPGIFIALVVAGCGFPIPEELPVLTAGAMAGHQETGLKWYLMLPTVIAGVVVGDSVLYGVGRVWGHRILDIGFVRRNFIPKDKQEKIEKNFAERGIWVLLGVRLLPGIRAPVFFMAGVLRVPLARFVLADALYAIPLVNIMFWLAYFLTDQVIVIFNKIDAYRPLVVVALLSGIAGALIQRYILSRNVSTGEAPQVPELISKPAVAMGHAMEKVVEKAVGTVTGRHHEKPPETPPDGAADQEFGIRTQDAPTPSERVKVPPPRETGDRKPETVQGSGNRGQETESKN